MENNPQIPQQFKRKVDTQVLVEQVSGNTYPHRDILKKMGCSWNADDKSWERSEIFIETEMKQILNLGLNIQRKILVKQIEMN